MSFNQKFSQAYRWRTIEAKRIGPGLEHLQINSVENNVIATGVLIGEYDDVLIGLNYTIICTADWSVRTFKIENVAGNSLSMNSDGEGNWFNANGSANSKFSGASDVSFAGTPFTFTPFVHRMQNPLPGKSQRLKILQISFRDLQPKLTNSQLTCVIPYKKYRFETRGDSFSADFEVDENGVAKDIPNMFTRQYPKA